MRPRIVATIAGLAILLGGATACSPADLPTAPTPVPGTYSVADRPSANQQSYCAMWMTYLQCEHFTSALNTLSVVCPSVHAYVTASSYTFYYDGIDTENFGYTYSNQPHAMWLTPAAFWYFGELSNTIAHEYGHNIGLDEADAGALGNACGTQY